MRTPKRSSASTTWKRLLEGRDVLLKGVRWQVDNGECIFVWNDFWIPRCQGIDIRTQPAADLHLKVKDLISMDQWDIKILRNLFPTQLVNKISSIYISNAGYQDELI